MMQAIGYNSAVSASEPITLSLFATGLAALAHRRRTRGHSCRARTKAGLQ
jgi:hypothetical protein